jgi:tetratricopeptide (TPR) repeat protein
MALEESPALKAAKVALERGDRSSAETILEQGVRPGSEDTDGVAMLGVLRFQSQKLKEAEDCFTSILDRRPILANTWIAKIRMARRDFAGALEHLQRIVRLGRERPDVYNLIGLCRLELKDGHEAVRAFRKALGLGWTDPQGHYHLGLALALGGINREAFEAFKMACKVSPGLIPAYVHLAVQMQALLNWSEGIPVLERGVALNPESGTLAAALASSYGRTGRASEAEPLFRRALKLDPATYSTYAAWLQEEGRFEESTRVYAEAIRRNSRQGRAYYGLVTANRFELDGRPLTDLLEVGAPDPEDFQERMFWNYARGRAWENAQRYDLSMEGYDEANRIAFGLYNAHRGWDSTAIDRHVSLARELYKGADLFETPFVACSSDAPIFIVGMIRSGTTLLDQILSTHPRIASAGEHPFWYFNGRKTETRLAESGVHVDELRQIGEDYLASLEKAAGTAGRVIDKLPTNYQLIGLLNRILPKARFVHLRRSPLDTCLSIYTTYLGGSVNYAYSQDNIVGAYQDYLRLMEFWRLVLPPGRMIEVDYESLVRDREPVLRELVGFLGLEWSDAMLHHEKNTGRVHTPSLFASRQAVSNRSVERWKRFEPWLGGLLKLKGLQHPPP